MEPTVSVISRLGPRASAVAELRTTNAEVAALLNSLGHDPVALDHALNLWSEENSQAQYYEFNRRSSPHYHNDQDDEDGDVVEVYEMDVDEHGETAAVATRVLSPQRQYGGGEGGDYSDTWRAKNVAMDRFLGGGDARMTSSEEPPARVKLQMTKDERKMDVMVRSPRGQYELDGKLPPRPPVLQQRDFNGLQRQVIPLVQRGRNVFAASGAHSGRSTLAAVLCDRFIDFSLPASSTPHILVMASLSQVSKLASLLAVPLSHRRAMIVSDVQFRNDPMAAQLVEQQLVAHARSSEARPLVIFIINAATFDQPCAVEIVQRVAGIAQVVVLGDEPSEKLDAVFSTMSAALSTPSPPVRITIRNMLRRVVDATQGSCNVLLPMAEKKKFAALTEILQDQLFDYQLFLVVAATRRKIERLGDALGRLLLTVVAYHRSLDTVSAAQNMLAQRISRTGRGNRICVVCTFHVIPLLEGISSKVHCVIYYDAPMHQLSWMRPFAEKYFYDRRSECDDDGSHRSHSRSPARVAGSFISAVSPPDCVLSIAFADGEEEFSSIMHHSRLRWVTVEL